MTDMQQIELEPNDPTRMMFALSILYRSLEELEFNEEEAESEAFRDFVLQQAEETLGEALTGKLIILIEMINNFSKGVNQDG